MRAQAILRRLDLYVAKTKQFKVVNVRKCFKCDPTKKSLKYSRDPIYCEACEHHFFEGVDLKAKGDTLKRKGEFGK